MIQIQYVLKILSLYMVINSIVTHLHSHEISQRTDDVEFKIQKAHEYLITQAGGIVTSQNTIRYALSGIESGYFNKVTFSDCTREEAQNHINYIIAEANRLKVPISWMVMPSSKPENLAALLKEHGFVLKITIAAMRYQLHEQIQEKLPENFFLKRATELDDIKACVELLASGFNYSLGAANAYFSLFTPTVPNNLEVYCGVYEGNYATIGCLLHFSDYAYLSKITTSDACRNKWLARALTTELLNRAYHYGLKTAILGSSPNARSLYTKMGFEHCFDFEIYVYQPLII
jgi:ribosomal protein S18 acetylase RimI-like enzyme